MSEVYTPDNLIADNSFPLTTEVVTIKADQILKRGAVLGKDSDGKYLLSLSTASDGSEVPKRILLKILIQQEPMESSSFLRWGI